MVLLRLLTVAGINADSSFVSKSLGGFQIYDTNSTNHVEVLGRIY